MTAPARSLGRRLALFTFAAIAGVAVLLAGFYQSNIHNLINDEADDRAAALAHHLAAGAVLGALAHSDELLAGVLDGTRSQPDVEQAGIFDADHNLIAARVRATGPNPEWPDKGTNCRPCRVGDGNLLWIVPIVREAAAGVPDRPRDPADFYAGPPPTSAATGPVGWALLTISTARRQSTERRLAGSGLLIAAVALVLGLVATLVIARRLTSPLRALARATQEIGKGRWDAPLPIDSTGEIGQLAADFRAMTTALAELDRENRSYREKLEERVAERTRELETAYNNMKTMAEAKDQFVATVSHDFRSPLAIIQSAVQTVMADPAMTETDRRNFLGRAERQCKRLGALVNDLLDLARIENRDAQIEHSAVNEVVQDGVEVQRPAFDDKGVTLEYQAPGTPVFAHIDKGHVARAVANLLDNALKFTPARGKVRVTLASDAGFARIQVADTGPGISQRECARVFERFFQGEQASSSGRGSGLGLAIVEGVARRHGGRVAVQSVVGTGSTFEIALPQTE